MNNKEDYEYMVKFMFAMRFGVGAATAVALNGITFCSDRGYWTVPLILLVLGYGAVAFGTLMRTDWVPFTYDQKPKRNDKRIMVDKKGKSVYQAFGRWAEHMLKILAYRSGTGSVSICMDSDCDDKECQRFDACLSTMAMRWYKDHTLFQDQRNLMAFHGSVLGAERPEDLHKRINSHLINLAKYDVQMVLNCTDYCIKWFVLRMMSFTLSQSMSVLRTRLRRLYH